MPLQTDPSGNDEHLWIVAGVEDRFGEVEIAWGLVALLLLILRERKCADIWVGGCILPSRGHNDPGVLLSLGIEICGYLVEQLLSIHAIYDPH